jgi:hypothetical protein
VINPQNGHILCDPDVRSFGWSVANSSVNQSVMKASVLRKRLRSQRILISIDLPSLSLAGTALQPGPGERSENRFTPGRPGNFTMADLALRFCARLLTLTNSSRLKPSLVQPKHEQFRPAILDERGHYGRWRRALPLSLSGPLN